MSFEQSSRILFEFDVNILETIKYEYLREANNDPFNEGLSLDVFALLKIDNLKKIGFHKYFKKIC